MTGEERSRLEELDRILTMTSVREQVSPIISRVSSKLDQISNALMQWEPIPMDVFGGRLPPAIRSGWIFVLRAGADTGPERHPNSHQRMMSMKGVGDIRTERQGIWRSNMLISDPAASLERRWISIPPSVWHRPIVGKDDHWVVVSFHTVLAHELIEERPGESSDKTAKQMRYIDGNALRPSDR